MKLKFEWVFVMELMILSSCDPTRCSDFHISNQTSIDLVAKIYSSADLAHIDSVVIQKGNKTLYLRSFSKESVRLSLEGNDSVHFVESKSNIVLKAYYPNIPGKNIYDTDNPEVWEVDKVGKRDYDYTFTITADDLK